MQHYRDVVQDRSGNVIGGAIVTVIDHSSGQSAPLYSDANGSIPLTSVITDTNGTFSFYVASGRYDITVSKNGIVLSSVSDVFITVTADYPTAMDSATAQAGTSTNAQTVSASVLKAGAQANGVTAFATYGDIPSNFVGVCRVGNIVYAGDGTTIIKSGTTNASEITTGTLDVARLPTLTKAMVGLSNVDNTSDLSKPASTATLAAQAAAEAARDAALIQAGVYTTEALGRAAVADGQAFKVQGSGDVAAYEYRRTNSTTSVLIATYPSSSAFTNLQASVLVPAKNKFNLATITAGTYVETNGGVFSNASYDASDYIPVVVGTTYVASSNLVRTCYFDSNKTVVAGGGINVTTFTVPATVAYVRISFVIASLTTMQLEIGTIGTTYESYRLIYDKTRIYQNTILTAALANSAVTPVKSSYFAVGKNKFDLSAVRTGAYQDVNGSITISAGYNISDFIPVTPSIAYISSVSLRFTCYFDANYNVVAGGGTFVTSFTPPSGAVYITVSITDALLATCQIEVGSVSTAYESYSVLFNQNYLRDNSITSQKLLDSSVTPSKASFFSVGKNKFNLSTAVIGYYVDIATGTLLSNIDYDSSDYIPVSVGVSYTASTNLIRVVYFDSNKTLVAGGVVNVTTFTVPAGAVYVRVSFLHTKLSSMQLEIGASSSQYQSYALLLSNDYLPVISQPVQDIVIPSKIYCLVGGSTTGTIEQSNIYFKSVCRGYINDKLVKTISSYGANYEETWRIEAGNTNVAAYNIASGSFPLSVTVQDSTQGQLISANTTIQLVSKSASTAVRLLCLGDSMTDGGTYITQVYNKLPNIITQGIRHKTSDPAWLNREGRGGWQLGQYVGSYMQSTGYDSPFMFPTTLTGNVYLGNTAFWKNVVNGTDTYNFTGFEKIAKGWIGASYIYDTNGYPIAPATGSIVYDPTKTAGTNFQQWNGSAWVNNATQTYTWAFNFSKYLVRYAPAFTDGNPTHFSILMGANDVQSGVATPNDFATFVANLETIITSVASAVTGIKFIINLCPVGATQDGWSGNTYQTAEGYRQNIQKLARYLITTYDNSASLARNIYLCDMQAFLDPVNGFDYVSVPANIYMGTNINRVNNTVHPNVSCGYLQMGDALAAVVQGTR